MANEGDAGFYSRYNGEEDTRGRSMVEIHREKMAYQNKEAALATLKAVWPQMMEKTLVAALQGSDWDADKAYKVLSMFQVTKGAPSAEKKAKKEKSSKKDDKKKKKSRKREASDDSDSESSSGSDSGDSDSNDSGHKKGKKHKDKHKKKKHKKEKKSKTESSEKKEKGQLKAVGDNEYGKFGIVRESDMWNKRPEFILWCDEIKGMNSEILAKWEERDLFKEYMEDYNTATLPHEKYYNYEGYIMAEKAKAAKGKKVVNTEKTTFNDEEDRKRENHFLRQKAKAQEVQELRRTLKDSGMVEDMREQERLRLKMQLAYQTGDLLEARKIQARLEPDTL